MPAVSTVAAFVTLLSALLGSAPARPEPRFVDHFEPAISATGSIAFTSQRSVLRRGRPHPTPLGSRIVLMRADGSRKQAIVHRGVTFESSPDFSPDGKRIAFLRDNRIFVMNRDGSGARRLHGDFLDQECPRFSPDGRKIAFWRGRWGKSGAYFVINTSGTGLRRLVGRVRDNYGCADWAPDGATLVLARDFVLYRVAANGSSLERLTTEGQGEFYRPSFSPDGTQIVCDGHDGRSGHGVMVMSASGTRIRRITTGLDELNPDTGAVWRAGGREILFSGYRDGFEGAGIYAVRADGTKLRRLTNFVR